MSILTLEEMQKAGFSFVTDDENIQFTLSIQTMIGTSNADLDSVFNELFRENLRLGDYTKSIKQLTITYLIYPNDNLGANWQERKYFKRKEKHFFIDIRFPDYDLFCNADRETALKMMAEQTLRGVKLFLSKEKDFDFEKFYNDVEKLFKDNGML